VQLACSFCILFGTNRPANHPETLTHTFQSSSDLPLLVQVQRRAQQLLHVLQRAPRSPDPYRASSPTNTQSPLTKTANYNIGFITPPFKDSKIPITDHLHLHAYIGDPDLAGWWRKVAYSSIAWYAIEDLIAEIR